MLMRPPRRWSLATTSAKRSCGLCTSPTPILPVAGIAAALRVGALTSDAVALEARLAADREKAGEEDREEGGGTALGRRQAPVVSLIERRLALPPDSRPLPSVAADDQLLRHTRPSVEGPTS